MARPCHRDIASSATGRQLVRAKARSRSIVSARLRSARRLGHRDLRRRGRLVAGSASFGGNELAEGFVRRGERLTIQACRFRGNAGSARVSVHFTRLVKRQQGKLQVVDVATGDPCRQGAPPDARARPHRARRREVDRGRPARPGRRPHAAPRGLPVHGPHRRPRRAHSSQPAARRAPRPRDGRIRPSERPRRIPAPAGLRPRDEAARDAVPVAGAPDHAEPQERARP